MTSPPTSPGTTAPTAFTVPPPHHPSLTTPFSLRAHTQTHPLARYLLSLMTLKKSNLCVSADVTTTAALLRLAEEVGDAIVVLKTHADIVDDWGVGTVEGLKEVGARRGFVVFEDRKFGDIGSTVQKQYTSGPLRIITYASLTNAHIFPGPAAISALKAAATNHLASYNRSVFTEISAGPPLLDSDYYDEEEGEEEEEEEEEERDEHENAMTMSDEEEQADTVSADHRPTLSSTTRRTTSSSSASKGKGKSLAPTTTQPQPIPGRKSSIVSTTVIETTTETIDPHRGTPSSPSLPRRNLSSLLNVPGGSSSSSASPGPSNSQHTNSHNQLLAELGPPPLNRALLILAQMSSEGNLMSPAYTNQCLKQAREHKDFVLGFVAQAPLNTLPDDDFLIFTPGVSLPPEDIEGEGVKGDGLGQQYRDPRTVVRDGGADVVIVGRGILGARDRRGEAERYRRLAWEALEERWASGEGGKGKE